ncbi:hypothetical protein EJ02DRAFT_454582 [Clathrospora elynae]|uniref:Uncharacterized protein n=1 Tax=Clathrospora elynae TaxID=706981 RepID=A0A6A5SR89_9PLEO|nr:hypothetical protein EJ02DRAFT_454582 [Clathrospora elynae]
MRDLICTHYIASHYPLVVSKMVFDEAESLLIPDSSLHLKQQHYAQTSLTGPEFLAEMVETLYETFPVLLHNTPHRATRSFLFRDPFGTSFTPSQHVRTIMVVVNSAGYYDSPESSTRGALGLQTWVVDCLRFLEGMVSKKCKIVVQVTETWKCLKKVLVYVGLRLSIMRDMGFAVEVLDRDRVVEWEGAGLLQAKMRAKMIFVSWLGMNRSRT